MVRSSGIGQEELRRSNLSAVLTHVHVNGPTTRAVLTTQLGLNRSTIGGLTGHLERLGLVTEEPSEGTNRRSGRPSHEVRPRAAVNVLAVVLDVDRIEAALVGLGGRVLDRRVREHPRGAKRVGDVVDTVGQMAQELVGPSPVVRPWGVGVSVPGAVRRSDGLVRFAPNLGWRDAPFATLLSERLGMSVATGNDADLGVLAEHLRGVAVGIDDVAYISGGVGVGGGFVVGGQPMRGFEGYAGEIGHLVVDTKGERCRCGSIGCWETKVGEQRLLAAAGWSTGGGPAAVDEVIAAADRGESRASESLQSTATWTGVGLRMVANVFNPEMVVLGGVTARIWEARQSLVLEGLLRGTLIAPMNHLQIEVAGLGHDSCLVGAAELAFAPLLADPVTMMTAYRKDDDLASSPAGPMGLSPAAPGS
jgi:predicted NBD/HSP70 family sugar kinase